MGVIRPTLFLHLNSLQTGQLIEARIRSTDPIGGEITTALRITSDATGTGVASSAALPPESKILSAVVTAPSTSTRGLTFAELTLRSGANTRADAYDLLAAGYPGNDFALHMHNLSAYKLYPTDVKLSTIQQSDPAVATGFTITVPTNEMWRIHAFQGQLQASATVGARSVRASLTMDSIVMNLGAFVPVQVADENVCYGWGRGWNDLQTTTPPHRTMNSPFPLLVKAGATITTNNPLALDQWGTINILAQRYVQTE